MLRPHQTKALSECITRLESHGLAVLEGQQRSGKSMVALKTAEDYCAKTLFLTKKKAIPGVKDDCSKLWGEVPEWLTIMNYESVHKLPDESWGLVILDECFSGDTLVKTISGDVEIKNIKKGDTVYTRRGPRKVLNVLEKKAKSLIRLHLSNEKTIDCTPDHLFHTDMGWVKAKDLFSHSCGLTTWASADNTRVSKTEVWNVQVQLQSVRKIQRKLRQSVLLFKGLLERRAKEKKEKSLHGVRRHFLQDSGKILLETMRSHFSLKANERKMGYGQACDAGSLQKGRRGKDKRSSGLYALREGHGSKKEIFGEDEKEQPIITTRGAKENSSVKEEKQRRFQMLKWWERNGFNWAAEENTWNVSRFYTRISSKLLKPHQKWEKSVAKGACLADLLQAGFGHTFKKNRPRAGWLFAPFKKNKRKGPKEDNVLRVVGMESLQNVEHGGDGFAVFDLTVEGEHNYFAGGVLVHNCHSSGLSSFPKPSLVWRRVSALFKRTKAKALLMSGTISIETKAQLYHEVSVTGRGPWVRYGNFFKWWNHAGHYKKPVDVGGYGIRGAMKRIGGGKEVTDYAQVEGDRIDRDISPLLVTVSRAQAGFKVTEASQKVVKCANGAILGLCDEIAKEGIVRIGDRLCVYETPAARLMGAHMACGGTLLDDQGQGFVLPDEFEPRYKLDLIRKRAKQGLKYVIFAHYIYERAFLLSELGDSSCEDVETFRTNDCQFCVLSTTSYSMGVDLSWLSGCCIMYSIPWSGAVWSQVLDRQLHFKREREAVVAVLLLEDGVDTLVYEAVSRKQNFNLSRYRCSKSISSPRS